MNKTSRWFNGFFIGTGAASFLLLSFGLWEHHSDKVSVGILGLFFSIMFWLLTYFSEYL